MIQCSDIKFVVPLQFLLTTGLRLNPHNMYWIMSVVSGTGCMKLEQLLGEVMQQKSGVSKFSSGRPSVGIVPSCKSPFQARSAGPFSVLKCLPGQNYLLKTPQHCKGVQVCHVNLLKPYLSPASPAALLTTVTDHSLQLNEEVISSQKSFSSNWIEKTAFVFLPGVLLKDD